MPVHFYALWYNGRNPSAATSCGSKFQHTKEFNAIFNQFFDGLSPKDPKNENKNECGKENQKSSKSVCSSDNSKNDKKKADCKDLNSSKVDCKDSKNQDITIDCLFSNKSKTPKK